jgi:hypothetical protein
LKAQIIVNKENNEIICTEFGKGKQHDFKIFKKTGTVIEPSIELQGDRGYQSIAKFHSNSKTPVKKLKKKALSKENKTFNKNLSSSRVVIEHVIGRLKVFRILSESYRNRRKRFNLRLNLAAGIYNYELDLN